MVRALFELVAFVFALAWAILVLIGRLFILFSLVAFFWNLFDGDDC